MKVKPLYLDFHKDFKPVPWLGLVLVAVGGIGLAWQAHRQENLDTQKELLEVRSDQLDERGRQLDISRGVRVSKVESVSEEISKIVSRQSVAPTVGLHLLEKTWFGDIAYLRVNVETLERVVKVDFEARHREHVLALVDAISKEPQVARVTLVRQTTKVTDPLLPTQAEVEFWWKEPPR